MPQKLTIILTIVVVVGILVGINSVTYLGEEKLPDSEQAPNRSTYHAGPTGTRALYDFLAESGYKVMRWRDTPEKLLGISGNKVQTFVIIGRTQMRVQDDEAKTLLRWVQHGRRLVLVDRRPEPYLLPVSGKWTVTTEFPGYRSYDVDPANSEQMTEKVSPLKPLQPTSLTRDVESVLPSRFASLISFSVIDKGQAKNKEHEFGFDEDEEETASPAPTVKRGTIAIENAPDPGPAHSPAPLVHFGEATGSLLVDYPYGQGRIIVLSDPYIFANGGIGLRDNLQLAINVVAPTSGLIAFDEFHQGRGATHNPFVAYFAGTPILAICGQLIFLTLLVFWTRGQRFARPLPLVQVDRRSSLEFVASMAELQQRARTYDLAIENIYSRTRRVLARYAGVEYNRSRSEIAARVASRSPLEAHQLETLMRQCEEAINGEPISERQSILLVRRLREVEAKLGLRMRSRDIRQAVERGVGS